MPAARGAHLYYDKSREQWQIRDSGGYVKRLPRASASCREDAEKALAVHIATRRTSSVPSPVLVQLDEEIASNPKLVSVAQVLAFYGHSKRNDAGNREFIGIHIEHLLGYWGDKVLAQVKRSTCEGYVEWRCAQTWAPPGAKIKKPVSDQTAARELNTLSAAIGVWHREHMLTAVPVVTRPGKRMKTPDWLTEIEYERLTRCAMGDRWVASDVATRQPIWENNKRPQEHLARFIHIAFFQGSRHGGILRQRWSRGDMHGYFDMTTRTCHRSGPGEPKTRKRETACRIHDRLFPMLEEWRQADRKKGIDLVIHVDGEAIDRIDQSFATAARHAGLDRRDVDGSMRETMPTPHILRHTRATLMLLAGVPTAEVAYYLGMTEAMVETTYGHCHVEYQKRAAAS
ncbi:tyrosine-type recombinase/integrase [Pelagibacterium halotolerans]|uniref:tyrosine-type recombinase/integrase n=1 Tax=Pelagibacterium halotolerans TaxID=531813 RepID=UPI00089A10CF|nr:tyrosine-type recombinase/integrase [Pelagibacterium halotolerans]QJR17639.1 tyrosine-type recombinase/integrase [Pelagibacterium halotolerans]SEA83948.1 Phage integrase family protein [Pelagibacterium halotolerans]